jgi:hypothetical protein
MRFSILVVVVLAVGFLGVGAMAAEAPAVGAAIPAPESAVENPAVESGGWKSASQALLGQIFAPADEEESESGKLEEPTDIDPTLDWTTQACIPGKVCYSAGDCAPGGYCRVDLYAGTHLCVCF